MKKPNIFEYNDYRRYLKDYVDGRKEENDLFSYGGWVRRLGIKSVSTLTMIVKKQRHMGKNLVPKFIEYFEFNADEAMYFNELVRLNKLSKKDPGLTVLLLAEHQKKHLARQLFSNWQAFALREATQLKEFRYDLDYLFKLFQEKIPKSGLNEIYKELIENEILDASYKPTDKVIAPSQTPAKEEMRLFHEELMELSKLAIDNPTDRRALHSSTLTVKKKDLGKAKELIRQFQVDFSKLIEQVPGDDVYQLNIQFFPLTQDE